MTSVNSPKTPTPYRQIRALYDDETVTVYQAYSAAIAEPAVAKQRLDASPAFLTTRMTWIKPSWCWMMYRSGYARKDKGQERILALRMRHEHFLALLERTRVLNADAPTGERLRARDADGREAEEGEQLDKEKSDSPFGKRTTRVLVQWDPERSPRLGRLTYRSIQIGIPAALIGQWVSEWIVDITDVTQKALDMEKMVNTKPDISVAELIDAGLMPAERVYEMPHSLQQILHIDEGS